MSYLTNISPSPALTAIMPYTLYRVATGVRSVNMEAKKMAYPNILVPPSLSARQPPGSCKKAYP